MSESRATALGTPCSPKWDNDWVAQVDDTEAQVGHRICGAHSPAHTPCKLVSTHINGRCRFHGGVENIGAPNNNRNAIIHGLYSRRLQRCGKHCPLWFHCPLAGQDVLDLPAKERPTCAYEKTEYDQLMNALTSSFEKGPAGRYREEKESQTKSIALPDAAESDNAEDLYARSSESDASTSDSNRNFMVHSSSLDDPRLDSRLPYRPEGPFPKEKVEEAVTKSTAVDAFLHHNITTFQIMLTRAQAAMGVARMVEETHADGGDYSMTSRKMSSMLQAEMRIARELRQWLKLLAIEPLRKVLGAPTVEPDPDDKPRELGWPERMVPILEKAEGVFEACLEPGKSFEDEYGTA